MVLANKGHALMKATLERAVEHAVSDLKNCCDLVALREELETVLGAEHFIDTEAEVLRLSVRIVNKAILRCRN